MSLVLIALSYVMLLQLLLVKGYVSLLINCGDTFYHLNQQMTVYCPTKNYMCSIYALGELAFRAGKVYFSTTENSAIEWYLFFTVF